MYQWRNAIYIYIYIYIHTHTHTHIHKGNLIRQILQKVLAIGSTVNSCTFFKGNNSNRSFHVSEKCQHDLCLPLRPESFLYWRVTVILLHGTLIIVFCLIYHPLFFILYFSHIWLPFISAGKYCMIYERNGFFFVLELRVHFIQICVVYTAFYGTCSHNLFITALLLMPEYIYISYWHNG